MSKQIPAVYEGGVIRPLEPPGLREGEELDVILLPRQRQAEKNPSDISADTSGVSREGGQDGVAGAEQDAKLAAMREAMSDELFLTDLREAVEDFQHADAEESPA